MHDPMSHRVNLGHAAELRQAGIWRYGPTQDEVNCRARIANRFGSAPRGLAFSCKRDNAGAANAFKQTMRQALVGVLFDAFKISRNNLEFDRRTAAVKYQYVHLCCRFL